MRIRKASSSRSRRRSSWRSSWSSWSRRRRSSRSSWSSWSSSSSRRSRRSSSSSNRSSSRSSSRSGVSYYKKIYLALAFSNVFNVFQMFCHLLQLIENLISINDKVKLQKLNWRVAYAGK